MLTKRKPAVLVEVRTSLDQEQRDDEPPGLVCLVSQEVPETVVETLDRRFGPSGVAVRVTKGRRRERRAGRDRRDAAAANTQMERRLVPDLEARRFTERRGEFEPVGAPILPTIALPYAEQLRFVRRRPRPIDDAELTRLRQTTDAWRERARRSDDEARGIMQSLVGAIEDLRRLRTMSPRWFLAVRRGDQAIAEYRDQHVIR